MTTTDRIAKALDAYRANPTDENRQAVLAAARAHMERFHSDRAAEYIRRTS